MWLEGMASHRHGDLVRRPFLSAAAVRVSRDERRPGVDRPLQGHGTQTVFGITTPGAVFTLIFGFWMLYDYGWAAFGNQMWLHIKLALLAPWWLTMFIVASSWPISNMTATVTATSGIAGSTNCRCCC